MQYTSGARLLTRWRITSRAATKLSVILARRPGGSRVCPICGHTGRFATGFYETGIRTDARCPRCGGLERHRLQIGAIPLIQKYLSVEKPRVLHFAPDKMLQPRLRAISSSYTTADLVKGKDIDQRLDIRSMSELEDQSFDVVWASHVLEHVDEDVAAIREIYRVLAPGGVAVLPVPLVADETVEYPAPSPAEHYHVRAPGMDYFDRYRSVFDEVTLFTSDDAPAEWCTYVAEDRSGFPTPKMPHRPAQQGGPHVDALPICRRLPDATS